MFAIYIMDVIVSTSKNPYKKIWEKRGSKYIDDDEFSKIVDYYIRPFHAIGCEKNEMIGNSVPMFCTEDLESIICTESTDEIVDDNVSNKKTFIKLTDFDIECK